LEALVLHCLHDKHMEVVATGLWKSLWFSQSKGVIIILECYLNSRGMFRGFSNSEIYINKTGFQTTILDRGD